MKKTAENFYLRGTMKQLNTGDKRIAVITDVLFLCLYLTGVTGWLISVFELTVQWVLLLPGLLLIATGVAILSNISGKVKRIALSVWFVLFALLALILNKGLLSGFNLVLNQAIDVLGKTFPYMWPTYGVSVSESAYPMAVSFAFVWLSGFSGFLGMYMIKRGNRLLLGLHFVMIFLVQMLCKVLPDLFWDVAAVVAILAVWLRSHGEKLPAGCQRLASAGSLVLMSAAVLLIYTLMQFFWPVDTYVKNEAVESWKEEAALELEEMRYAGSSQVLPEGNFTNLGSFQTSENPVLEVTMTSPESYYLRGFTGSVYTGTGWEETTDEQRWEYRDLFYWLHEDGYYGQEALSQAAVALGDVGGDVLGAADENVSSDASGEGGIQNLITIENINGSSRYCYVPYELYSANTESELPFSSQKIGDENLLAEGTKGSRAYTYSALSNQVTNYAALAAKLVDENTLDEAGKQYQKLEGYYNQYVYENYLDIPGNLRTKMKDLAGDVSFDGDEKHADYAEAKQNILYILNSECTYQEELKENWDGTDFVADFLNLSKEGYSVHYASAATMMFRYYGIPARYVEGYLITPEDVEGMTAGEAYIIDETHAHAWVEYYQDGVGWLPFETTPSYLNVMPKAEDYQDISGTASGNGTKQEIQEDDQEDSEEEGEDFDWLFLIEVLLIIGIVMFVLLLLALFIYVIVQRQKSKNAKRLFVSANKKEAVRSIFSYTMNILAVAGLQIRNTSLYRYGAPIEKMFDKEVRTLYEEVVEIRQEAVYSDHEITEEQRRKMLEFKDLMWKRVYRGANWVQKFQLKYIYFL